MGLSVLVMFSFGAHRLYLRHNLLKLVLWFYTFTLTASGWDYVIRRKKGVWNYTRPADVEHSRAESFFRVADHS